MARMQKLPKLKPGDKVAIVSPSFAAPAVWPHVFEYGLGRLRTVFGLDPVLYPSTAKLDATLEEKAADLIAAFSDPKIKAVISTLGGDIQVTYIKNLPGEIFSQNPKPFFGYSDNSHFCNHLFLNGIPSFYGAALFTQFAYQNEMDPFTVEYIKHALFDEGEYELKASIEFNDIGLSWEDSSLLNNKREYEINDGWSWDGKSDAKGLLWGGCIESVDEMLRHDVPIPTQEQFSEIVLMLESSEEIPSSDYVGRVMRAFGERGILELKEEWCDYVLPPQVEGSLKELTSRLGIQISCPEFLLKENGDHVFIDMNPCGDWAGFFEESVNLEISNHIAQLLLS